MNHKPTLTTILQVGLIVLYALVCFELGQSIGKMEAMKHEIWLSGMDDRIHQVPDRITDEQIVMEENQVIIKGNYEWSEFTDTQSMLPVLYKSATGLSIMVNNSTEIIIGDIISFKHPRENSFVVHRVISIDQDEEGVYYTTKGDNLYYVDAIKVRRDQIKRVMVGVLW